MIFYFLLGMLGGVAINVLVLIIVYLVANSMEDENKLNDEYYNDDKEE